LGHPGHLPEVYSELEIEFHMLRRLLGVKTDDASTNKVKKINKSETLMLNVGSTQTGGRVEKVQDV
jgi:translation initiation factor 2 subunit 3